MTFAYRVFATNSVLRYEIAENIADDYTRDDYDEYRYNLAVISVKGREAKIQYLDVVMDDAFAEKQQPYLKEMHQHIMFFDLEDADEFDTIDEIMNKVKQMAPLAHHTFVGIKSYEFTEEQRFTSFKAAAKKAELYNAQYFELDIANKSGFRNIVEQVVAYIEKRIETGELKQLVEKVEQYQEEVKSEVKKMMTKEPISMIKEEMPDIEEKISVSAPPVEVTKTIDATQLVDPAKQKLAEKEPIKEVVEAVVSKPETREIKEPVEEIEIIEPVTEIDEYEGLTEEEIRIKKIEEKIEKQKKQSIDRFF